MKNKIFILFFLILIIGCTEIGVIEENIPFEQKYVINGRLKANSHLVNISFSKSFELNENDSKSNVALDEITAYVWSDNNGIYPLQNIGEGNYQFLDSHEIISGNVYELHGKIDGKRIYSSTYVPKESIVESILYNENHLLLKINAEPNVVYGCRYTLSPKKNNLAYFSESTFYELSESTMEEKKIIEVRTSDLPESFFENISNYSNLISIYAFDKQYKEYYNTRLNNKPIENIFSEGGGSVYWNVEGENVIGVFIGYSQLDLRDPDIE